ncbi:MAG: hypothetical protein P4L87_12210, partial [Formivibrio sp.]|nr:hypothetical protein [Formivibrio sp.]
RLITLNNATSITPDSPTRARVGQCLYVGQNSMQISMPSGSVLRANQHPYLNNKLSPGNLRTEDLSARISRLEEALQQPQHVLNQ